MRKNFYLSLLVCTRMVQAQSINEASKNLPGTADPIHRSFHSLKRLPNKKILFFGGICKDSEKCEPIIWDPKTKKSTKIELETPEDFSYAVGFRINNELYGFSNRSQDFNPHVNFKESELIDVFRLWDMNLEKWKGPAITFQKVTHASTPAVIRLKDKVELIYFEGEFIKGECTSDEVYNCKDITGSNYSCYELNSECGKSVLITVRAKDLSGESVKDSPNHYGSLRIPRIQFDTTTFSDGRIFIAGGKDITTREERPSETAEFYLPEKKSWYETAPLPNPVQQGKTVAIGHAEVAVVDLNQGHSYIWSFITKQWRIGFKNVGGLLRVLMHSSGRMVAKLKDGRILIWNPQNNHLEYLSMALTGSEGSALIELEDHSILESSSDGIKIWDISAKKVINPTK